MNKLTLSCPENTPSDKFFSPCQEKEATRNYGFTLVELIVVITILAILGTIAFISLQGYSKDARDSTRISDLSAMKTSLELFQLDAGKYPDPTDGFIVSYSGSEVWTQGIFGTTTFSNISKLDKIPKDPLTDKEYTYSVTKTKQEYQFAGIIEGDEITQNLAISQTNAGDLIATALVTGTYNGQIIKTESGTNCNILSLPSIISSEPNTTTDLSVILTNKSLVFNGYNNLPTNYISSKYKTNEGFPFESKKIVVYDDSASCTPLYNPEDNTARVELLTNLQQAYSGTLIENEDSISGIVNLDLKDTSKLDVISATLVNNDLGGDLVVSTGGGVGGEETTNSVLFLSNCTENGQFIYTDITGTEIGRVNNAGNTISGNPGSLTCSGHIIACSGNNAGYILQACNMGATGVGGYTETAGQSTHISYGNLYQFGKLDTSWTNGNELYDYDWKSPGGIDTGSANDWGVLETNSETATWLNSDATSRTKMQGPCPTNYHVPTFAEWVAIVIMGSWADPMSGERLSNTLKLPVAGKSSPDFGIMESQGSNGYYWSSSPHSNYGTNSYFGSFYVSVSGSTGRATGFSVRCIKN